MPRIDKLAVAVEAVRILPPLIRAAGRYSPATAKEPAHWEYDTGPWKIMLTGKVLLCPIDAAQSMLLDVWGLTSGKVLSVSWMPESPWVPVRVVQCKPGPWLELLGADALPDAPSNDS